MKQLTGILPAIVTAFDKNGALDLPAMHKIIRYQLDAGVNGFYLTGSTGEGMLLTQAERQQLLEFTLKEVNGQGIVIAHIGAYREDETIALAKHACKAGADAISALPPCYFYKADTQGMIRYYTAIADATTIPLLVYNLPSRTGITMTHDLFDKLMKLNNVVGMKDSSGNLFSIGLYFSGGRKPTIFNGEDTVLLYGLLAGCCGGIGATYNVMPHLFVRLWKAFKAGDIALAVKTQLRINEIANAVLSVDLFGGVKQTMAWMGLPCGDPRAPGRGLNEEEAQRLRKGLEAIDFFSEH